MVVRPGVVKTSGGVNVEPVISEAAGISSATVGGSSTVSAEVATSELETTFPRLL